MKVAEGKVSTPRPMTHDLIKTLLLGLGTGVRKVVVNELREDTFYALIWLEKDGELITVDSRPSDAIALAIRVGTTIYAEESVLAEAGVAIPDEQENEVEEFKKFLDEVTPEDFERDS